MKRALVLIVVLGLAIAGLIIVQRRHDKSVVSPNAVLNIAADVERDTLRAPMHFTRLSDEEESRIGDEMAANFLAYRSPEPMPALEREVQRIGGKLAAHAHRKLRYQFHLITAGRFQNAFALPGGHVFIGLGLIKMMDTEDELAGVLGHELEHIDHYHCAELVQVQAQMRKLHLDIAGDLLQIPLTLFQVGYTKDQEAEADREGLLLSAAAGYSPYGFTDLFEKFEKYDRSQTRADSPPEEAAQVALGTLSGYFRSHPETHERIAQARATITAHHLESHTTRIPLPEVLTAETIKATE